MHIHLRRPKTLPVGVPNGPGDPVAIRLTLPTHSQIRFLHPAILPDVRVRPSSGVMCERRGPAPSVKNATDNALIMT